MANKKLIEAFAKLKAAKQRAEDFNKLRDEYTKEAQLAYWQAWQAVKIDGLKLVERKYPDRASFEIPGVEDVQVQIEIDQMFGLSRSNEEKTIGDIYKIEIVRKSFGKYDSLEDALRRKTVKEASPILDKLIADQVNVGGALRKAFTYFERNKKQFEELVELRQAGYTYPDHLKTKPDMSLERTGFINTVKELLQFDLKKGIVFDAVTFDSLQKKAENMKDILREISTLPASTFSIADKFADQITGHASSKYVKNVNVLPLMFDKADDRPVEVKKMTLKKFSKKSVSILVDEPTKAVVSSEHPSAVILNTSYATRKNWHLLTPSKQGKNIKTATSISRYLVLAALYSNMITKEMIDMFK